MSGFYTFERLLNLGPAERQHLAQLEEALQDSLLAGEIAASNAGVDQSQMDKAILPLLMTIVARQYLNVCETRGDEPNQKIIADLAAEALEWARKRGQTQKIMH